MPATLLERDDTLATLERAVSDATAGRGSVALVTGEAGIGKTTLVRAFAAEAAGRARLLTSACDDLMAPRTLGPLRDAALGSAGPLADGLQDGRAVDGVFGALLEELATDGPVVLVVEDVHWADDATLDVLGYAARRIQPVGAVLVLTYRDDEIDAAHSLHRFLGTVVGAPLHRLPLRRLSRHAVARLSAGSGADPDELHRATRGNPFFVTEALASPEDAVPLSVVEAVLARVGRLGEDCRDALEQLSVVPSHVQSELAATLLGPRVESLVEAELAGVLEVGQDSLAFRHELARRAIERSLPEIRRQALNAAVVAALLAVDRPERARVMHHAVEAGDVATITAVGPEAAREAAAAGSHRQALAHFESVLPYLDRLGARSRAAFLDDYGWELYNAHRFREAVDAGLRAAELYDELGDAVAMGECLVRVSRHLFMAGDTDAAHDAAARAVATLEPAGDEAALAHAALYRGAVRAMTDAPAEAAEELSRARGLAQRSGRDDLAALSLNYLGIACFELGDMQVGVELLRRSIAESNAVRHHEYAARGHCNLAELLSRAGRLDELEYAARDGLRFARERGFWSHAYNLEVQRCTALVRRGRWDRAAGELRALIDGVEDPGMLISYSVPWLGRVLARQGDPEAAAMLVRRLGAGPPPAAAARRRLRRDRAGRVGVAGGRARHRRRGRRGAAAPHGAPRRRPLPRRAAAPPRPRRPPGRAVRRLPGAVGVGSARRLARRGRRLGGGRRPLRAGARAGLLRRARGRRSRACGSSTGSAPRPPRRSPAGGWRRSAGASRGRAGRPAPTRPGSPTASSPCSRCSATGSPTRRSPNGSWSPCGPSTTTSPRC